MASARDLAETAAFRPHAGRGYTLAELIVAMGLATILSGIVFGGILFMSQSAAALRAHHELQTMSELAALRVERDIQEGRRVLEIDPGKWSLERDAESGDAGERVEVVYQFDNATGILYRTETATGDRRVLLEHVRAGQFRFWGRGREQAATEAGEVLRVSFEATLVRQVGRRTVVEKVVSASFLLRNIEFGELVANAP